MHTAKPLVDEGYIKYSVLITCIHLYITCSCWPTSWYAGFGVLMNGLLGKPQDMVEYLGAEQSNFAGGR